MKPPLRWVLSPSGPVVVDAENKVVRKERDLLWGHACDRVDWFDGESEVAALADELLKTRACSN